MVTAPPRNPGARFRLTTSAGNLSFHWFLALFPAVIALTGVASLIGLSGGDLQPLIRRNISDFVNV